MEEQKNIWCLLVILLKVLLEAIQLLWQRAKYETAEPQYSACHKIQDNTLNSNRQERVQLLMCSQELLSRVDACWLAWKTHPQFSDVQKEEGQSLPLLTPPTTPMQESALNLNTVTVLTCT